MQDGRLRRQFAKQPIQIFGPGEREAIALAKEHAPRVATLDALRWAGEAWGLDELRAAADRAARTEK